MSLPQLRRVRWAVRATLLLGVAASVAANIFKKLPAGSAVVVDRDTALKLQHDDYDEYEVVLKPGVPPHIKSRG